MAGIRAGLGVLLAAALLAPSAWACVEPEAPDEPQRVTGRAGDEVTLEVPNTLEGAEWALRLADGDEEDDPLARGEDVDGDEPGVEAGFEVPDLGAGERSVDLVVDVSHEADEADWSYRAELEYRGRAAADPSKDEDSQAAPAPRADETSPPPAPERTATSQPEPAPAASTPARPAAPPPAPPAEQGPVPAPTITAPTPSFPGPRAGGPAAELVDEITALGAALPALVQDRPAERRSGGKAAGRRRASRREAREQPPPAPESRRAAPAETADEGGIRLPHVEVPGLGSGLAWSLIAGGTLAFALAGLCVGGLARHRRRRIGSPAA